MIVLAADQLCYYYQDGESKRIILDDLSIEFETGKFYAVMGPSGSGKSTLLTMLAGLDHPKEGVILFRSEDIKKIGLEKHRRNHIGIVFQNFNLIRHLNSVENLLEAMSITDNEIPSNKKLVAYNLLQYIGITKDRAQRSVTKLSGGEQQRVAIARALSTNVDIILADEPTGNLNKDMSNEIILIFKKLAHDHNKTVIVMTHSDIVASEADICLFLENGKLHPWQVNYE